ncbi:MAG: prenyltransferase [Spirochaetaceae bacterium]
MSSSVVGTPLKRWFLSLRPYSFTASLMPVAVAVALSLSGSDPILWWTVPFFALSALLFHAGTNVLNDYYDYRHGVDGPDDEDPTHAITQGTVSPRFMLISGHLYFLLGVLVGAPIALERGAWFLLSGIGGALGAYFYTNARFSFKYVALGDLLVFLLMGPALVVMGVWALTGGATPAAIYHAVPMALLVTAILHGNNLRNIENDSEAGIRTVATLLGEKRARLLFDLLLFLPFLLLPLLILTRIAPITLLLPLPALIPAIRLSRIVHRREDIMLLPKQTAQLHLLFTLLYVGAVLLGRLL